MNRTRATFLLIAASLASLGATGCHRHRMARGMYAVMAPQPMAAPQPIVIVVETRTGGAPEVNYAQEAAEQEAAARETAAREEAVRQARIEHERAERARIERERARIAQERAERARLEQEQARRDAQARAAQGQTTIIVLSPGAKPVQVDGWFQGQ
jgi:hypothetical protein